MQRQISELIEVTNHTTNWRHNQQARSVDTDKTLASLRVSIDALQSLQSGPCQRLQDLRVQARTDGPPGESVGISQLRGKRQNPSFSLWHRRHPKNGNNKTKCSFAVRFLSVSLAVRTRTLSRSFVLFPSLILVKIPARSSARRAVTMPALCFNVKQRVSSSSQPTRVKG